ncbi:MAG TPA: serine hydrolase [Burkholderiaceae bacterium]|nr:serine hydrolase [Burkholderiaceae bacterium]
MSAASDHAEGRPADIDDGWAISSLEQSGFDAEALRRVVQAAATHQANLHSVVLARRGELVAEFYFTGPDKPLGAWWQRKTRFGPGVKHDLRSISKSVVGLLFGIAQAQGKIAALNTPVLEYFPEHSNANAPERRAITLEHLLTMTPGLDWNASGVHGGLRGSENRMRWARNRERYILVRPVVAIPGSHFSYNDGTTALLASVLEQVTGMPLETYAREVLFAPLGITDLVWKTDLRGKALAFSGLRMRPRDLARIGRMLLAGGRWQDRQVVPEDWVRASMQPLVSTGDGMQYGYHWWVSATAGSSAHLSWSAAFGHGGQRLFIVPSLDLTVVLTAGHYKQTARERSPNDLFRRIIATALP